MAKQGKNTHLEHLEDNIINLGSDGGKQAVTILRHLGNYLTAGDKTSDVFVTTKWDGAPAVICGTDPADGKFFVGTKSVFSQSPKICKTESDVQRLYNGALAQKLSACLRYLADCGIKGVLQGDLMFTDDKIRKTIGKTRYLTFRPNTITYAVDPKTPLGKKIDNSSLGIVFHTKYTGNSLATMKASFDVKDSDFNSVKQVWIQKATFEDMDKRATFSKSERVQFDNAVNMAEGSLKKANTILDLIQSNKKPLGFDTEFKKFFNNFVKNGQDNPSVKDAYILFAQHLGEEFAKAIAKNKTLKAQEEKVFKFVSYIDFMEEHETQFKMLLASYFNLQRAKLMLVDKMKVVTSLKLFVDMGTHYEATNPEGFVAVSSDGAVKLIDRLEFSRLNFTVPKQWG